MILKNYSGHGSTWKALKHGVFLKRLFNRHTDDEDVCMAYDNIRVFPCASVANTVFKMLASKESA
jgi:hypothetical protein